MDFKIHFAYQSLLYILVPLLLFIAWLRYKLSNGVLYRYPLATELASARLVSSHPHRYILVLIRFITLAVLAVLIAKPQLVDSRSKINVEGIDIMLVMDVSGSMHVPHHSDDDRSRLQVAKEEAIRFVDKRTNDAIGLVIFGEDSLSRCPLTADKSVIKQMIHELEIGIIPHDGTVLAKAIITAVNRLKKSTAKSKVMILLTDGSPSEKDIDPKKAIAVAKKLGIKIYTVGIGDEQPMMMRDILNRIHMVATLNKPLLTSIATETGGQYFEAKSPKDMRAIYDTIDKLEKTELETPLFSNVVDWFMPLVWFAFALVLLEIVLSSVVWFSI